MDTGNNSPAAADADADAVVVVRRATKMHGSRPAPDPEGVVCIPSLAPRGEALEVYALGRLNKPGSMQAARVCPTANRQVMLECLIDFLSQLDRDG